MINFNDNIISAINLPIVTDGTSLVGNATPENPIRVGDTLHRYEKKLFSVTGYTSAGTFNDSIANYDTLIWYVGGAGAGSFDTYGAQGFEVDSTLMQNTAYKQNFVFCMGNNSPHFSTVYVTCPTLTSWKIYKPGNYIARIGQWFNTVKFTGYANSNDYSNSIHEVWGVKYR